MDSKVNFPPPSPLILHPPHPPHPLLPPPSSSSSSSYHPPLTIKTPMPHSKEDILEHPQQPLQYHHLSLVPLPLHKAKSWSPDIHLEETWLKREEAWLKRKEIHLRRNQCNNKSLTDCDLDELKACFELGFSFDSSSKLDPKLRETFPALEFYCNVLNNKLSKNISRSTSLPSFKTSDLSPRSPNSIIEPGDDPNMVKMRLRHWAQVVACSLHVSSPK